jgi:hypothetical protein
MSGPWDYEQDAAYDRLYEELGPQWAKDHGLAPPEDAIKEFTAERLQSYYVKHPDLATTAIGMMEQASVLSHKYPNAAFLFATSAAEITIKHLLVRPIVNGLVHNEAVADVVMALTPVQTGSDAFKNLLFGVLKKVADVDLATYKRPGSDRTLWEEWKQLQKDRNNLIHDGVPPSSETIGCYEAVAVEFLSVVFPKVLATLGLRVSGYLIEA